MAATFRAWPIRPEQEPPRHQQGQPRKEVVSMRLMLDTSKVTFTVTKAPEPRKDFGKDQQKIDPGSGKPQWVVEVLALDEERGEVIRVTVAGDEPKVRQGQPIAFSGLEAIAWTT